LRDEVRLWLWWNRCCCFVGFDPSRRRTWQHESTMRYLSNHDGCDYQAVRLPRLLSNLVALGWCGVHWMILVQQGPLSVSAGLRLKQARFRTVRSSLSIRLRPLDISILYSRANALISWAWSQTSSANELVDSGKSIHGGLTWILNR
jgi:hypothetical protein